jgi:hypothetical protein
MADGEYPLLSGSGEFMATDRMHDGRAITDLWERLQKEDPRLAAVLDGRGKSLLERVISTITAVFERTNLEALQYTQLW